MTIPQLEIPLKLDGAPKLTQQKHVFLGVYLFLRKARRATCHPGAFMASHDCDLKTSLKYVAVLALHRRGWLDRYNGVPRKVIAGAQAWQKSIGAAEEFECSLDFGVGKSFWE